MDTLTPDLETRARRRANAKMAWTIHAFIYITVNSLLALGAWSSGRHGVMFPVLGWGLGLLIHGMVVFFVTGGGGLHERLVAQERVRLQRNAS